MKRDYLLYGFIVYLLWVILLFSATRISTLSYWQPIKAVRNIEFREEFTRRLIHHGLQYDVNAVVDGKFFRNGQWCQFWENGEEMRWE